MPCLTIISSLSKCSDENNYFYEFSSTKIAEMKFTWNLPLICRDKNDAFNLCKISIFNQN